MHVLHSSFLSKLLHFNCKMNQISPKNCRKGVWKTDLNNFVFVAILFLTIGLCVRRAYPKHTALKPKHN